MCKRECAGTVMMVSIGNRDLLYVHEWAKFIEYGKMVLDKLQHSRKAYYTVTMVAKRIEMLPNLKVRFLVRGIR